jgi:hypothetical protein
MFSYVSPEERVPKDHPLRPIKVMVDNILANLAPLFRGGAGDAGDLLI